MATNQTLERASKIYKKVLHTGIKNIYGPYFSIPSSWYMGKRHFAEIQSYK